MAANNAVGYCWREVGCHAICIGQWFNGMKKNKAHRDDGEPLAMFVGKQQ